MSNSQHRKSLLCCWALVISAIALTVFNRVAEGQPQVFFKASQLPAKSLPRIGRRGDIDPYQGVDLWSDVFTYDNNNYNVHPDSILLWKKLTGLTGENVIPADLSIPVGPGGLYKVKED